VGLLWVRFGSFRSFWEMARRVEGRRSEKRDWMVLEARPAEEEGRGGGLVVMVGEAGWADLSWRSSSS